MNESIDSGWSVKSCRALLMDRPEFDPQGLFFVIRRGKIVGTACAWATGTPKTANLHMLGVAKAYRGKGLGLVLTEAVLGYFASRGYDEVSLSTDAFRKPAIRCYLRLGFEPQCDTDEEKRRWQQARGEL